MLCNVLNCKYCKFHITFIIYSIIYDFINLIIIDTPFAFVFNSVNHASIFNNLAQSKLPSFFFLPHSQSLPPLSLSIPSFSYLSLNPFHLLSLSLSLNPPLSIWSPSFLFLPFSQSLAPLFLSQFLPSLISLSLNRFYYSLLYSIIY